MNDTLACGLGERDLCGVRRCNGIRLDATLEGCTGSAQTGAKSTPDGAVAGGANDVLTIAFVGGSVSCHVVSLKLFYRLRLEARLRSAWRRQRWCRNPRDVEGKPGYRRGSS